MTARRIANKSGAAVPSRMISSKASFLDLCVGLWVVDDQATRLSVGRNDEMTGRVPVVVWPERIIPAPARVLEVWAERHHFSRECRRMVDPPPRAASRRTGGNRGRHGGGHGTEA